MPAVVKVEGDGGKVKEEHDVKSFPKAVSQSPKNQYLTLMNEFVPHLDIAFNNKVPRSVYSYNCFPRT